MSWKRIRKVGFWKLLGAIGDITKLVSLFPLIKDKLKGFEADPEVTELLLTIRRLESRFH
jgi:hypothetical protein